MKIYRKYLVIGIIILFVGASVTQSISENVKESIIVQNVDDLEDEKIIEKFNSIPLFFTENVGQFPENVLFRTHTSGAIVYLCQNEIILVINQPVEEESYPDNIDLSYPIRNKKNQNPKEVISIVAKFLDTNSIAIVKGKGILPHHNNYFISNEEDKWYTNVYNYKEVYYTNIYPGIDLKFYGSGNSLKYDFLVSPSGDPSMINICYEGMEDLRLTSSGDLEIRTKFGSIYEKIPLIYQEKNGVQQGITGGYELRKKDIVGFTIDDSYDPSFPIIIDPVLGYSTYLGRADYEAGLDIDVDDAGFAYVTGYTNSYDFPIGSAYDPSYNGDDDVFITKFAVDGKSLVYSTFLGGGGSDVGVELTVDSAGFVYVTGHTDSTNFPVTIGGYNNAGGLDAFVTKLDVNGQSLIYSTCLGGSSWDFGYGIAVDSAGSAYVTGSTLSSDFKTKNPIHSYINNFDAFVTKFVYDGQSLDLDYSTYLGGGNSDSGSAITVDSNGHAYVIGTTESYNFPMENAYDDTINGWTDAFISKLTYVEPTLALEYSTFLGGDDYDQGHGIAVDPFNRVFVAGHTKSSNFPGGKYSGGGDVFLARFSDYGALEASRCLGGTSDDCCVNLALLFPFIFLTGDTSSNDFPTSPVTYDNSYNGNIDAFVTVIHHNLQLMLYSTYLGGTSQDEGKGIATNGTFDSYITGFTKSYDYPVEKAYQGNNLGEMDVFVTNILFRDPNQIPPNPNTAIIFMPEIMFEENTKYECMIITPVLNWDNYYLYVEWGDEQSTEWIGPYEAGEIVNLSHSWDEPGTYTIRAKVKNDYGNESNWDALNVCVMKIAKPESGLYIMNKKIFPLPSITFIIGNITLEVEAPCEWGLSQVEFYIDDKSIGKDSTAPYSCDWRKISFGKSIIKVIAFDIYDNIGIAEKIVYRFF